MSAFYADGRYLCRITSQALGKSKNKGTPYFALQFVVLSRAIGGGEYEKVPQNQRTAYMYITPGTAERLGEDLARLGFPGGSFKLLDPNIPGYCDFTGLEVEMYTKAETYEGKESEKWSMAMEKRTMEVQPLDAKATRELDNLFGKFLKKQAPRQASHLLDEPPPPTDDDFRSDADEGPNW